MVDEDLEATVGKGLTGDVDGEHLGDTVAELDLVADLSVLWVGLVVLVGHDPLVDGEDTTWLEDLVDLLVALLEVWRVAGGLDGVDLVEGALVELEVHEVALDEVEVVLETGLLGLVLGLLDLVVVVVETDDVTVGEPGNLSGGATNTTADVEDEVALLDASHVREVVLVSGDGGLEVLALVEATEVEGGAPAVLVEVGDDVVVGVGGLVVVLETSVLGVLVDVTIPKSQVLLDSLLLGALVLGDEGRHAGALGGVVAVQLLGEVSLSLSQFGSLGVHWGCSKGWMSWVSAIAKRRREVTQPATCKHEEYSISISISIYIGSRSARCTSTRRRAGGAEKRPQLLYERAAIRATKRIGRAGVNRPTRNEREYRCE